MMNTDHYLAPGRYWTVGGKPLKDERPKATPRDRRFATAWRAHGPFRAFARGTRHIPALTLSVFGGIQPGKIRTYIEDALDHRRGDDGLIQRVQILVWPDSVCEWKNVDRSPDSAAKDQAFRIFQELDNLDPSQWSAKCAHNDGIPALRFSDDAQKFFDSWRDKLESRLRSKEAEETPSFTGHLAKYRSLMPSLALIFHLIHSINIQKPSSTVSMDAAQLAALWCEFLEAHARKVYVAEVRSDVSAAHQIGDRIRRGDVMDGMSVRDLARKGWSGLDKSAAVEAGLDVLESVGWLRRASIETGGRPSQVIRLHPELRVVSRG